MHPWASVIHLSQKLKAYLIAKVHIHEFTLPASVNEVEHFIRFEISGVLLVWAKVCSDQL